MKYEKITKGRFVERPNRFIAKVEIDGSIETVHVKNTGRCRELLVPGAEVVLSIADNPNRKTKYDLVSVYKKGLGLVNMDSQAPNQMVKEWLLKGNDPAEPGKLTEYDIIKPEHKYGNSRFDFYAKAGDREILIEVKGCTLEIDGIGYFPDAPTERGTRHVRELIEAKKQGYEAYLAFVIQMPKVKTVQPNQNTDEAFTRSIDEAKKAGVKILYLNCDVKEQEVKII